MFGSTKGDLVDRLTQRWVQATGRRVDLRESPWLDAPVGDIHSIGFDFFDRFAKRNQLVKSHDAEHGLLQTAELECKHEVAPEVAHFYEHTGEYDLDAWSEWCGAYRPFGHLLALLFSRRLQQLNVPISSLDTARGMTSDVVRLLDKDGVASYTLWLRRLLSTGNVLYAGSYSVTRVPRCSAPCVKVAFPLPNGNALVIMRPETFQDGSLKLHSSGDHFGGPGFYFTVHSDDGRVWARYVKSLRETIHVHPDADGSHADHVLSLWGGTFLRLHYRMRRRRTQSKLSPTTEKATQR